MPAWMMFVNGDEGRQVTIHILNMYFSVLFSSTDGLGLVIPCWAVSKSQRSPEKGWPPQLNMFVDYNRGWVPGAWLSARNDVQFKLEFMDND